MKKNFQKKMLNFQLKSIRINELNLIFTLSNFNNNKNWNVIFERIDFCIENNPIINIDKIFYTLYL